jgi:hypothetical protein
MSSAPLPSPGLSPYRVTLFFGPEPVEERPDAIACVFNVKKRSWKAGIQVSVEIHTQQLLSLREQIRLTDRLSRAFSTLDPLVQSEYEGRAAELFAQAVCWCKLDLHLNAGVAQENQRISGDQYVPELDQALLTTRQAYAVTYILTELDLPHED